MPQWPGFYKEKSNGNNNAKASPKINGSQPPSGRTSPSLRSISRLGSSMSLLSLNGKNGNSSDGDGDLLHDILEVRRALDCFLDSRISEAEEILAPRKDTSMYYALGYGFILFLKCVMTFEQSDIEKTVEALKKTINLANNQRKRDAGWLDNITTWMKGNYLQHLKSMTTVQRHAELVYGEAYLLKALVSIVHDESIVSFLREGLNIRHSYNIYRNLEKYVDFVQQEAAAGKDISMYQLDDHFTSGVALGIGCFNVILSLLPTTVVKVAEFMGFSSDREHGLSVLESIGGWDEYRDAPISQMPELQGADEGLRRQLCDMFLIMYHIVLSKMVPLSNVDQGFAERILNYNLKLYPSGVFFLYFSGRLLASQGKLEESKNRYNSAIKTQQDWKQLQHICYWELGLISIVERDWDKCYELFGILHKESNWSKAVYAYLRAMALYMKPEKSQDELRKVQEEMKTVNASKKKIAGKSIPMEKFTGRKARQFLSQDNYLLLPDLEILNAFSAYDFMPLHIIQENLDRINSQVELLKDENSSSGKKDRHHHHFYDDLCLVHYLRAVMSRLLLKQQQQRDDDEKLRSMHKESIDIVLQNAKHIELDHYIYYFTLYENARMLIMDKKYDEAESAIQIILRAAEKGQYNVGTGPGAKNKYSLENALVFKCHNCIDSIRSVKHPDQQQL